MFGNWNATVMGPIAGACLAACDTGLLAENVAGYTSTNQFCVLPPPNCMTATANGNCTLCQTGFSINKGNNLCTPNPLTPGCVLAVPTDASICALCMAGPTPDKQFILNSTGKCNLDCPAANRKTLLPSTISAIPPWLQGMKLMMASCTPCSSGCSQCLTKFDGTE